MKNIKYLLVSLFLSLNTAYAQEPQERITVHDSRSGADEVIELPEGMSINTDSLLSQWKVKKYLYPDTTCKDPNINPEYSPEVYQERLRRLPVVMEMPYNNIVQQFIDRYSGRLRNSVSVMLGAGNMYIPIFEEALDLYGLPLELKYLPVIESALNPTAVSRAGAVGLWQFMLPTAKRYGLTVNSLVDERRDPYKATHAAAKYLRDLYKIFNDWSLVIAAYNCGPSNVTKAIHRADGAKDYWTIYPYLPQETRGYVPAFIAANYIMNYYCEHNICPYKTSYPIATDTVLVTRDLHIDQVAELCNVEREVIKALNPQYRTDVIPGGRTHATLCLPQENLHTFIDLKDSVYNYRADELLTRRNTVIVPEVVKPARPTASRTKSKSRGKSVTVRSGDTLSHIARRNHTTVAKLRKLNGIKGSNLRPGQKIRVK